MTDRPRGRVVQPEGSGLVEGPRVSVVVASYRHAEFVTEALDSVAAQTLRPTQLIVTDDTSPDDSAAVISAWLERSWPDAVFLEATENRGLPATLNAALELVDGEYVALLAADDVMRPDRLARQIEALENAGPGVAMAFSDMGMIDEHSTPLERTFLESWPVGAPRDGDLFADMIERSYVPPTASVFMRTDAIRSVGPYDTSMVAEDYDMFLRLSRDHRWVFVDEPLVSYRQLSTSMARSDAFQANFRLARIQSWLKHVGVSERTDDLIAQQASRVLSELYERGHPPRAVAADASRILAIRRTRPVVVLWCLATLRVPGRWVRRVRLAARRRLLPS